MKFSYIQFRDPVSVGGDWNSITAWSVDRHASTIEVEEKQGWIILIIKKDSTRRRVPMSNVTFISEKAVV